jgi:RNA polymerase sigma-70 factor, ECF subfamily
MRRVTSLIRKRASVPISELLYLERPACARRWCRFAVPAYFPDVSVPRDFQTCGGGASNHVNHLFWTIRSLKGPSALKLVKKKIDSASEERSRNRARLMARMQDGDSDSCRALLDDIGPMLTGFLRRRIADAGALEDVYQETLMALFEARHTYDPSRPLEPWLFAIARNIAADHARRFWTRATFEQLTDAIPERLAAEEPRSDPSLEDAMARLPEQQREAFSMLKLEGLSIEQAADRAGISVGALRVRAHRAYKSLRKLISD